ncbi:MAG TPA: hypothetical protein VGQ19_03415 [Burkholderiales bacterium]|jgi:hypothetical protein|nr:hypothetical protein [Burkholderiales bacterium]
MDFINELGIGIANPSAWCGGNWVAGERSFASINPARGEASWCGASASSCAATRMRSAA